MSAAAERIEFTRRDLAETDLRTEDESRLLVFRDYLTVERNRSPHTLRAYLYDTIEYLKFLTAFEIETDRAEPSDIRGFFGFLTGAGMDSAGKIKRRRMSARTQRRKIASIRAFYGVLRLKQLVEENPAREIRMPRVRHTLPGFLPFEETRALLESNLVSGNHLSSERVIRDRAIYEMLYSSGMRISELMSLTLDQATTEEHSIKVMGKGKKERYVFLGPPARSALKEYLLIREKFAPRCDQLFLNRGGLALSARSVRKNLVDLGRKVGVQKRMHPHRFRHSMATDLLNEGADIRSVQELLGHASLSSTQVYTAVSKDRLRDVYRATHPHGRAQTQS